MSLYNAEQQFLENLKVFGDTTKDPEKHNLYAGLLNMCKSLETIEYDIQQIKEGIRNNG